MTSYLCVAGRGRRWLIGVRWGNEAPGFGKLEHAENVTEPSGEHTKKLEARGAEGRCQRCATVEVEGVRPSARAFVYALKEI